MSASSAAPSSTLAPSREAELEAQVAELTQKLERETYRSAQLAAQVKEKTKKHGELQLQCEQEEEYISNRLMKRLETLKQEKEDLARQVEFEEEMITNKLSKKLEQVKQEKVNLENLLEQEQEYIVNKLQKQLSTVLDEKRALETRLRENTEEILGTIHQHLQQWRRDNAATELPPPPPMPHVEAGVRGTPSDLESDGGEAAVQRTHLLVTHLTAQIDALGQQQETYHRDCTTHQARNAELRAELQRLQADNAVMAHRVAREREKARDSEREKARLETELEQETERAFNLGSTSFTDSRSRGSSYPPSPALSSTSTPALISPRLVLTLPYSPARDHSRRDSSESLSGTRPVLGRGTSESSLSGADSASVSRPDSAGGASNPTTPGRAPRAPSPHSTGKPKQTGS